MENSTDLSGTVGIRNDSPFDKERKLMMLLIIFTVNSTADRNSE